LKNSGWSQLGLETSCQSFRQVGVKVEYVLLKGSGDRKPESNIGLEGDLFSNESGRTFVRKSTGWVQAENNTAHPNFKDMVLKLDELTWISKATLRARDLRARTKYAKTGTALLSLIFIETVHDSVVERPLKKIKVAHEEQPEASTSSYIPKEQESESNTVEEDSPTVGVSSFPMHYAKATNPANNWLVPLLDIWKSRLHNFPKFEVGLQVFEALLHQPDAFETPQAWNPTLSCQPKLSHVLDDLFAVKDPSTIDIVDHASLESFRGSPSEIVSTIVTAAWVDNWNTTPRPRQLAALSIPMSQKGLKTCGIRLPQEVQNEAVCFVKGKPAEPFWSSSLCSPGAVTDPHIDYHGSVQAMYHIEGVKLWLIWPLTNKNFQWYNKRHDRVNEGNVTLQAIQELEGMKVLAVYGPSGFFVPPYGIHAVISLSPCAHTGLRFWSYQWMEQSFQGVAQELEWLLDPKGQSQDFIRKSLQEIKEDLGNWNRLLRMSPSHPLLKAVSENLSVHLGETNARLTMLGIK
jgi:hypothetical protein